MATRTVLVRPVRGLPLRSRFLAGCAPTALVSGRTGSGSLPEGGGPAPAGTPAARDRQPLLVGAELDPRVRAGAWATSHRSRRRYTLALRRFPSRLLRADSWLPGHIPGLDRVQHLAQRRTNGLAPPSSRCPRPARHGRRTPRTAGGRVGLGEEPWGHEARSLEGVGPSGAGEQRLRRASWPSRFACPPRLVSSTCGSDSYTEAAL